MNNDRSQALQMMQQAKSRERAMPQSVLCRTSMVRVGDVARDAGEAESNIAKDAMDTGTEYYRGRWPRTRLDCEGATSRFTTRSRSRRLHAGVDAQKITAATSLRDDYTR